MEVPRSFPSTLKVEFFLLARARLETALLAGRPHRGIECPSEAADVDRRHLVGRRLEDVAVVMGLDEFAPVDRRAPSVWTFARGPGPPNWRRCAGAAHSGRGRCGRLHHAFRRAAPEQTAAGLNTAENARISSMIFLAGP